MTPDVLPIVRTLSVMLTHKCNAACEHCGTLSSPRVGGRADLDRVLASIDQAAALRFGNVVFTGGEPTIYFEDLLLAIAHARSRGLSTRVVTNAGWCRSGDRAAHKLDRLLAAGLDEINYSAGDEHQRFVPIDHVAHGIVAALDRSVPVHLMIEKVLERGLTRQTILSHQLIAGHPRVDRLGISESPWMPLDPMQRLDYAEGSCANHGNVDRFPGCDSILQTYVLHPKGEMTSCCGIGARVIPELRAPDDFSAQEGSLSAIVAEAEEDFLKLWMRHEGPERILDWAAGHDPTIDWEDRYAHRCQACARIYADPKVRRVISDHYEERLADVMARSYMLDQSANGGPAGWTSRGSTDSGSRPPSAPTAP